MIEVSEKLPQLLEQLNQGLVERDQAVKLALLTVLAGENIVLIGPPGTGKSMIARRIADSIEGGKYFEYLLTKFSTPEEIFGPLSIAELKADRFRRNTEGYLPDVNIAFLDEVFKASSSILNALLTILNERKYHNGNQVHDIPLQSLIAASNELPTGQEELGALYDRFLVRCFVGPVSGEGLGKLIEGVEGGLSFDVKLTMDDLENIRNAARAIVIPAGISDLIQKIWHAHREKFKEDRRETLSDRRLRKVLKLLRVSALINGRSEVDVSDVYLLRHCLWSHADNIAEVNEIVNDALGYGRPGKPAAMKPHKKPISNAKQPAKAGILIPRPVF